MAAKPNTPELTAEQARELLRYDPETGQLFWNRRARDKFQAEQVWRAWNNSNALKEAFKSTSARGYKLGCIFGKSYFAHRIAWLIVFGRMPSGQIDHLNGNTSDNRLANLRECSPQENMRNKKLHSNNSSGQNGVWWYAKRNRWRAQIKIDGKQRLIGHFKTFEEAVSARRLADEKYGFNPRHGT